MPKSKSRMVFVGESWLNVIKTLFLRYPCKISEKSYFSSPVMVKELKRSCPETMQMVSGGSPGTRVTRTKSRF